MEPAHREKTTLRIEAAAEQAMRGRRGTDLAQTLAPPPLGEAASAAQGEHYCSACTPATSQPPWPWRGLVMYQTSWKGVGPAEGSSTMTPLNSTLAM